MVPREWWPHVQCLSAGGRPQRRECTSLRLPSVLHKRDFYIVLGCPLLGIPLLCWLWCVCAPVHTCCNLFRFSSYGPMPRRGRLLRHLQPCSLEVLPRAQCNLNVVISQSMHVSPEPVSECSYIIGSCSKPSQACDAGWIPAVTYCCFSFFPPPPPNSQPAPAFGVTCSPVRCRMHLWSPDLLQGSLHLRMRA